MSPLSSGSGEVRRICSPDDHCDDGDDDDDNNFDNNDDNNHENNDDNHEDEDCAEVQKLCSPQGN